MIKMTRACPAMARPASPKSRCSSIGPRVEGGVAKHHQPHSPGKSFKTYTKTDSTAECLAKLKNLLPNARLQKHTTELALVEETIAYITYLESILSAANDQDHQVVSTAAMLQDMQV